MSQDRRSGRDRTPVAVRNSVDASDEARFGRKVKPQPNGCWLFGASLDTYGQHQLTRKHGMAPEAIPAHRFAYETLVGPIPEGHHLHHECGNPGCVNPAHLEPLTPGQHAALHAELRRTA